MAHIVSPETMLISLILMVLLIQETVSELFTNSTETPWVTVTLTTPSSTCYYHHATLTAPPRTVHTSNHTIVRSFTTTATFYETSWVTAIDSGPVDTSTIYGWTHVTTTIQSAPITIPTLHPIPTTVGTVTLRASRCLNGSPQATSTVFTGTFTAPPSNIKGPWVFATAINCYTEFVEGVTLWTTTFGGAPSTTILYPSNASLTEYTTTYTTLYSRIWLSAPTTTHTISFTSAIVAHTVQSTTLDDCPETATVTYHAKCAPTNLIKKVNGSSINFWYEDFDVGHFVDTSVRNPSDCCQKCLDTEGCAAMMAGARHGPCWLYIPGANRKNATAPGEGHCGLAFSYTALPMFSTVPIDFEAQTGCGVIVPGTRSFVPSTTSTYYPPWAT